MTREEIMELVGIAAFVLVMGCVLFYVVAAFVFLVKEFIKNRRNQRRRRQEELLAAQRRHPANKMMGRHDGG